MADQKSYLVENPQRRGFIGQGLKAFAAGVALSTFPSLAHARMTFPGGGAHAIAFRNAHTGEVFKGEYRVGDRYLPDAFDEINNVLRDFRTNEVFPIDPRVIDILYMVQSQSGRIGKPYEILSGYRCPRTNAMLNRTSDGVASNSLHMTGQAVDVRLPSLSTRKMRNIAVGLKAGGVGYYPKSNFVHLDTGRVRSW